jgi:hypothetical protein
VTALPSTGHPEAQLRFPFLGHKPSQVRHELPGFFGAAEE